jgi:hypothetical protein
VREKEPVKRKLIRLVLGLLILGILMLLCMPFNHRHTHAPASFYSANNLKQIGLAFHSYHDNHGHFPPAVVRDKEGKPLYSWRVLLLVYLDAGELYHEFHLDEPWDSPHNKTLIAKMPSVYCLPTQGKRSGLTPYQVFIGPGTLLEKEGITLKDIPDGNDKTILVAEARVPVEWTRPVDLDYDPNRPLPPLGGEYTKHSQLFGETTYVPKQINVLMVHGGIVRLPSDITDSFVPGLITRNGGEQLDWSLLD